MSIVPDDTLQEARTADGIVHFTWYQPVALQQLHFISHHEITNA
jgi:hypothetical protein